jgi:hypothetical protein
MRKVLVRYKLKTEHVAENQALVEAVYAELHANPPAGFRYTTLRAADGVTWFHLASIEAEGGNPLERVAAFKQFTAGIRDRCEEPPSTVDLSLVGAFGFFDQ